MPFDDDLVLQGQELYVVNAKFGSDPGVTDYEIVRVARN